MNTKASNDDGSLDIIIVDDRYVQVSSPEENTPIIIDYSKNGCLSIIGEQLRNKKKHKILRAVQRYLKLWSNGQQEHLEFS